MALPFSLVTILLLPLDNSERSAKLISSKLADKAPVFTIQTYADLDNDGYAEEISHFSNIINQCAVKIITQKGVLLGQWNFNGTLTSSNSNLLIFDYNNNGGKEVFTIYNRADSVFMGGLDPTNDSAKIFEDIFIDKISCANDIIHFSTFMRAYDMDDNGFKEVIIALSAGYSEQPRRFIIWDPIKNTTSRSASVGIKFGSFTIEDIDKDGTPEIIPVLTSNENIDKGSGIQLNDWNRWLAIYDHELEPEFDPLDMGVGNGSVYPVLIRQDERPLLFIKDYNKKTENRFRFYTFDWNSKTLSPWEHDLSFNGDVSLLRFQQADGGRLLIIDQDGVIHILNTDELKLVQSIDVGCKISGAMILNINNDSLPEVVFKNNNNNQLCIFSNDFKDHAHIQLPDTAGMVRASYRDLGKSERHLIVQAGHQIYEYEYEPVPYYRIYISVIYLLVYLGYVLSVWLIIFVQKKYFKNRYEREKLLAELKLKSIRNQMDPHFTFNAVNAIASAVFKEDKQNAYTYFAKFSNLIRSTMLYSDRMTRMLDDELEFTLKYLEIEKFRFREKFEYEITVDDEVDLNMEVPRMIVQAFAESAISNGLMHKTKNGLLVIKVYNEKDHLKIEFTDNGVGIERSKELNKEKAFKAVKIMEEFITVFNEFNKPKIKYTMHDVIIDGQVSGTKADIEIPFDVRYTLIR
ncbi:MAG: hypothetical protein B6D64_13500 [Bacteroidetes bacterium 4484_276]|nr:MAG: hypothetical protein B6D64_13500 [Bacteroidetes bacterium 4484_276]